MLANAIEKTMKRMANYEDQQSRILWHIRRKESTKNHGKYSSEVILVTYVSRIFFHQRFRSDFLKSDFDEILRSLSRMRRICWHVARRTRDMSGKCI